VVWGGAHDHESEYDPEEREQSGNARLRSNNTPEQPKALQGDFIPTLRDNVAREPPERFIDPIACFAENELVRILIGVTARRDRESAVESAEPGDSPADRERTLGWSS
jgi:hypothetical protein